VGRRVAIVLLLAGCASGPEWYWSKPGSTRAEFDQDAAACEMHSASATATIPGASAFGTAGFRQAVRQRIQIEDACMRSKGWVKVPAK
jgi:hypothetical protein